MKTSLIAKAAGATGFIAALLLATAVQAGPGPQYWSSAEKTPAVPPVSTTSAAKHLCPGAATVPVTVMKPMWSNGRGPLAEVQTGTKVVCRMCPVTQVTTKNDWSNGRGPSRQVEAIVPGALHDCTTSCAPIAMK